MPMYHSSSRLPPLWLTQPTLDQLQQQIQNIQLITSQLSQKLNPRPHAYYGSLSFNNNRIGQNLRGYSRGKSRVVVNPCPREWHNRKDKLFTPTKQEQPMASSDPRKQPINPTPILSSSTTTPIPPTNPPPPVTSLPQFSQSTYSSPFVRATSDDFLNHHQTKPNKNVNFSALFQGPPPVYTTGEHGEFSGEHKGEYEEYEDYEDEQFSPVQGVRTFGAGPTFATTDPYVPHQRNKHHREFPRPDIPYPQPQPVNQNQRPTPRPRARMNAEGLPRRIERYNNQGGNQAGYQKSYQQGNQAGSSGSSSGNKEVTDKTLKSLATQVAQLASDMSEMKNGNGRLPSDTTINPQHQSSSSKNRNMHISAVSTLEDMDEEEENCKSAVQEETPPGRHRVQSSKNYFKMDARSSETIYGMKKPPKHVKHTFENGEFAKMREKDELGHIEKMGDTKQCWVATPKCGKEVTQGRWIHEVVIWGATTALLWNTL
ncbi:hypothetical protein E3N88_16578 [Mikania micrantha]|uniref:Uncharacterized protein n=1 Tax=Mikania micrantha TaxID=192012 RepID=A0A5N6P017_9ASTR|nr:hypothetical protein E3N88_16578 [Mikania micrantha]